MIVIDVDILTYSLVKNSQYEVNSLEVMKCVKKSTCTAYDCEYVALADELKIKLITNDKKILKQFPKIAVNPIDFTQSEMSA